MSIYEYNVEEHEKSLRSEAWNEGREQGILLGIEREKLNTEKERLSKEKEKKRADAAEKEVEKLRKEIEKLKSN